MAKCKKCFFPNRADAQVCVKCGTPLVDETSTAFVRSNSPTEIILPNSTVLDSAEESVCNKTVLETSALTDIDRTASSSVSSSVATSSATASSVSSPTEIPHYCPECGYYVRKDAKTCAKCGTTLVASDESEEVESNLNGTVGAFTSGTHSTFNPNKTIDPRALKYNEPEFTLTALEAYGVEGKKLHFKGEETMLNRDNLDEGNMTITSKLQARIMCTDGHWYIIDDSTLKTTFVQAARITELQDGDIVLFGDRKFKFSK